MGTIIVAGVLVLIVVFIIRHMIKSRKNGSACGGDCSRCGGGCH